MGALSSSSSLRWQGSSSPREMCLLSGENTFFLACVHDHGLSTGVLFRCIICLFSLQELDEITKTECLHFFHKHCLGRYITNMQVCSSWVDQFDVQFTQETYKEQKEELLSQNSNVTVNKFQLSCPVCRENIGAARCNWSKYGHCMCSNVFHQVNLVTTWVTFS